MACLSDETIVTFVRGDLPEEALADVEAHLEGCPDCCALVAETARLVQPSSASETTSREPLLPPGATVSRYVIEEALGAGGAGVVYRASDPELGRKVALKLLPTGTDPTDPSAEASPSSRGRQLREAKAMARLSHPHVVNVYDVGTHEGRAFVVMELVDGRNLAQWLRESPRSWREILDVFLQAGRGLAAAHAVALVHRDFKPENILIGSDGRARVADFGLARVGPSDERRELAGTPGYMAPEQLAGGDADARSDQFSFCVALYAALYGRKPFSERPLSEVAAGNAAGEVPRAVHDVTQRGLSADPGARFPSMDDLLAQLTAAAAASAPVDGASASPPPRARSRRRLRLIVSLSAMVVASTAGALIARRWVARPGLGLPASSCFSSIAMGYSYACGIDRDGTVACWGKAGRERFDGLPPPEDETIRTVPLQIRDTQGRPLSRVTALYASHMTACARTLNGRLWCWGDNSWEQLGTGRPAGPERIAVAAQARTSAKTDAYLQTVVRAAPGTSHTCARIESGWLYCWGDNWQGQLGIGEAPRQAFANLVSDENRASFADVAAGYLVTCATRTDTSLWCWGNNDHGKIAAGRAPRESRPRAVLKADGTPLTGVTSFALGNVHGCAATSDGTLQCWGGNQFGQVGAGTHTTSRAPTAVLSAPHGPPFSGASVVRAGLFFTCVLKTDRTVWCFGDNQFGQLGAAMASSSSPTPVQVVTAPGGSALTDVQEIVLGSFAACARQRDGSLWCWGKNHGGQLGTGDTRDRGSAVRVQGACQ